MLAAWLTVPAPFISTGRLPVRSRPLLLCVYSLRCRTSELRPLGDQPRKDCMHRADNASGHMAQAQD